MSSDREHIAADTLSRLLDFTQRLEVFGGDLLATGHDEWMDRLAERMNQAYEAFGESDRVRYVGSNVGGSIEKVCPQCGGEGSVDSGGFREDGHPIPVPCGECAK